MPLGLTTLRDRVVDERVVTGAPALAVVGGFRAWRAAGLPVRSK
jgi:hypothetical protein